MCHCEGCGLVEGDARVTRCMKLDLELGLTHFALAALDRVTRRLLVAECLFILQYVSVLIYVSFIPSMPSVLYQAQSEHQETARSS